MQLIVEEKHKCDITKTSQDEIKTQGRRKGTKEKKKKNTTKNKKHHS